MLLLIPFLSCTFSFSIPFLSFHSFTLSFYRTLYNLYLNPNLLKILLNYTYTIHKVTTLLIYILTFCLIFFTHFHFSYFSFISIFLHISTFPYSFSYSPSYISIFFTFPLCISIIHSYLLYFSFMHFHHTFLLFLHIVLLCLN